MIHFDGDALVYIAGFAADSRNGPFSHSAHNIKLMINKALEVSKEQKYRIFLTSQNPKTNFRTKLLDSYKMNRSKKCYKCQSLEMSDRSFVGSIQTKNGLMKRRFYTCLECGSLVADSKPVYYNKIRKYLVDKYKAIICKWGEADDWFLVTNPKWVATHDKDIYQGGDCNFYNLKSGEILSVIGQGGELGWKIKRKNEKTVKKELKGWGFKWFCIQMVMGDRVDNIIKPHKGDGAVWFSKVFMPLETPREYWNMVKLYYKLTDNYDKLELNSQLVWVSRKKFQRGTLETIEGFIDEIS